MNLETTILQNLSGFDLKNRNFTFDNLVNTNLYKANMYGANLSNMDLRTNILLHANLCYADLSSSNLSGLNLEGVELIGANLSKADLSNTNLAGIDFTGSNLKETKLINANLFISNLTDTNLYNANLQGADICRANLTRANLEMSNMISTNLTGVNLTDANLINANLTESNLYMAELDGTDFTGANLTGTNLIYQNNEINPIQIHQFFESSLENYKELILLLNSSENCDLSYINSIKKKININETDISNLSNKNINNIVDEIKTYIFHLFNPCNELSIKIDSVLNNDIHTIFDNYISDINGNIHNITFRQFVVASFEFISRRTTEFKQQYISFFLDDSLSAYDGSGNEAISCSKGILERFITTIPNALSLSLDKEITSIDTKENLQRIIEIIVGYKENNITPKIINLLLADCWNYFVVYIKSEGIKEKKIRREILSNFIIIKYTDNGNIITNKTKNIINNYLNSDNEFVKYALNDENF